MLRTHNPFLVSQLFLWIIFSFGLATATPANSVSTLPDSPSSPAIVIGFLGGFVRHNNPVHTEVQLAARLRREYPQGVYVEVFQNHRGGSAYRKILHLLDADHSGKLTPEE